MNPFYYTKSIEFNQCFLLYIDINIFNRIKLKSIAFSDTFFTLFYRFLLRLFDFSHFPSYALYIEKRRLKLIEKVKIQKHNQP